jgi:cytochrome c
VAAIGKEPLMMEFREGSSGGGLLESPLGLGFLGPAFRRTHVHVRDPTHPPLRGGRPAGACAACATAAAFAPDAKGGVDTSGADRGKELFMTNACSTCHGVTKEDDMKVGPSLFGVVGRKAGTAQSLLGASENLKKYGVIWNAETLDEFRGTGRAGVVYRGLCQPTGRSSGLSSKSGRMTGTSKVDSVLVTAAAMMSVSSGGR